MRKRSLSLIIAAVMAIAAIATSVAVAGTVAGNNGRSLSADMKISPKKLSKTTLTPASVNIVTKNTTSSSTGVPGPAVQAVMDFDKSGKYSNKGLPTCNEKKLVNKDDAEAAKVCKGALIGTGDVSAVLVSLFAGASTPETATAKLTAFNGVPKGGKPTVLLHAYATEPALVAYIFSGVVSNYNKEGYGSRFEVDFPSIFGGSGVLTEFNLKIDKKFTYKGKERSLISAKCPSSKKLKTRVAFNYSDGETITVPSTQSCKQTS
jgi:hypothetical protein